MSIPSAFAHLVPTMTSRFSVSTSIKYRLVVGSLVCFAANTGFAQSSDDSLVDDNIATLQISPAGITLNIENCESVSEEREFTLSGTYSMSTQGETFLVATTGGSSCTIDELCTETPLDDGACSCLNEENATSITRSFSISDLFDEPCEEGVERSIKFFLQFKPPSNDLTGQQEYTSPEVKLLIDLLAPNAPDEAASVTPAEEALVIKAPEVSGDIDKYEACVWPTDGRREDARCQEIVADTNDRFEGLQNDQSYKVVYAVYDGAGNRSEDSPISEGTPASVLDFAEVYSVEYPGGERGGCQASSLPRTPLFLLGLYFVSLVQRARKNKHRGASAKYFISLIALWFISLTPLETWANPSANPQSPMNTSITLQGGAYQPSIDDEFIPEDGVQLPYERVFQDQSPVMFQVQADRHLFSGVGLISVGGSVGYWSVEGEGLSVTSVTESTKLSIIPVSAYVGYRFDLYQDFIPLVPSVKFGASYYMWSIYDGGGDVAHFKGGEEASGGTMGWFYSIGAHFLLDFLDREMAWAFDRDAGVNHSYLSVEYQVSTVNDFGDPDSFRLGSEIFLFGVTLDI